MKKKILIVDFNGTAPTYTHYFSNGLKNNESDVVILGFKNPKFLKIHNTSIRYIGFFGFGKILNYILNWIFLLFIARSFHYINIQWLPMLKYTCLELYLLRMLKLLNPQVYYTVHNVYPHNCRNKKLKSRYLSLYKIIDNFLVHTVKTENKIKDLVDEQKNIIKIKHGYFYSEFNRPMVKLGSIKLLMLGNISKYKGVLDALKVVKELSHRNCQIKLDIIGKGEIGYVDQLNEFIEQNRLEDLITLQNRFVTVEELIDNYRDCSMVIMPYKQIEQSGVLFTSLGLGVPVVGYKTGGIPEIISDGINGYLVDKDNIFDLCNAVLKCHNNLEAIKRNINKSVKIDMWSQNAKVLKWT